MIWQVLATTLGAGIGTFLGVRLALVNFRKRHYPPLDYHTDAETK